MFPSVSARCNFRVARDASSMSGTCLDLCSRSRLARALTDNNRTAVQLCSVRELFTTGGSVRCRVVGRMLMCCIPGLALVLGR